MGEGDLGILYALIILAPLIVVVVLVFTGLVISRQAKTRAMRRVGVALVGVVALGVVVPPLINAAVQYRKGTAMLAISQVPETLDFQGAAVLEVNMPLFDCDSICEVLQGYSDASGIWSTELGEGSESFYRSGPFDLTGLRGFKRDADNPVMQTPVKALPEDIKFVLIHETKWLNYHDPEAVIQFPTDAYEGVFIYAVSDAMAFDIATAAPLAVFWQQEALSPTFLWFSQATNDQSRPHTQEIAQMIRTALCGAC